MNSISSITEKWKFPHYLTFDSEKVQSICRFIYKPSVSICGWLSEGHSGGLRIIQNEWRCDRETAKKVNFLVSRFRIWKCIRHSLGTNRLARILNKTATMLIHGDLESEGFRYS